MTDGVRPGCVKVVSRTFARQLAGVWLYADEGLFAKLSKRRLKRRGFHPCVDL
ncbi:hypothetical protein MPL3365_170109 [Mesorhizobium plurifarium]|uniref:Uncharacterized protein n=1 Tax=Mesorhizobium plurifarium TaxID=69974 RepID=A0A090FZ52_MESPL|nr:hypothetical protein MPL3365_170109 [Mesorhizobium plurifarium]